MTGLVTFVWDFMNKYCMYFQNALSTKWLIIWGVVALILAIASVFMSGKGKNGEDNIWIALLSVFVFLSVYATVFFIGVNEFKGYEIANSECGYYCIIAMLISTLLLISVSAVNGTIYFSVAYIIFIILSALLFSKFVVALGILLGIGVFAGGSSHVGTFTDKDGNSYDVYKKD